MSATPKMKTGAEGESDELAGLAAKRLTRSGESSPNPVSTGVRSVSGSSADLNLSVVGWALAGESSPSNALVADSSDTQPGGGLVRKSLTLST